MDCPLDGENTSMSEPSIQITVNGVEEFVPGGLTIESLVALLKEKTPHLLVEHNGQYIFAERWSSIGIESGDRLELIQPCFGG